MTGSSTKFEGRRATRSPVDCGLARPPLHPREDSHQFASFAARVRSFWHPLPLEREPASENFFQRQGADPIGRPVLVMVGIDEKDCEQAAARLEQPNDRFYIVLASARIDRAEAGVLENPIEVVIELRRQSEQIRQQVFLVRNSQVRLCLRNRARRQINAQHVILRCAQRPDIVTGPTAWDANFPVEGSILLQKIEQRGMRFSFFPWRLVPAIRFFPISLRLFHGCGSLALSRMFAQFSNRLR